MQYSCHLYAIFIQSLSSLLAISKLSYCRSTKYFVLLLKFRIEHVTSRMSRNLSQVSIFSNISHFFEPLSKKVEVKTNFITTKAIFATLFALFCGQSVFSRLETVVRCEDSPVYPSDTQLSDCLTTQPAVIYLVSPIVILFLAVLNFIPERVYELRRGSLKSFRRSGLEYIVHIEASSTLKFQEGIPSQGRQQREEHRVVQHVQVEHYQGHFL